VVVDAGTNTAGSASSAGSDESCGCC